MTKKTFNIIVNECRESTCYSCGAKADCDKLIKAGLKTPFVTHFSMLPVETREAIGKVEER